MQEWVEDLDDPKDQHRHISNLIAIHPGRQISPVNTLELAEAAKVSMNARGDGATGWSKAWRICMWARLHDGDRAYKLAGEFIRGGYEMDIEWKEGKLAGAVIRNVSNPTGECELRYGEKTGKILVPRGESREFTGNEKLTQ